jgi:CcmD family protein
MGIIMKRFVALLGLSIVSGMLLLTVPLAAQQPPSEPQEEFLPIDQLPPAEQLPAAPLLVTAYAFAWLAVMFYVWTVRRRLTKVETDMRVFEKRHGHRDEVPGINRTQTR